MFKSICKRYYGIQTYIESFGKSYGRSYGKSFVKSFETFAWWWIQTPKDFHSFDVTANLSQHHRQPIEYYLNLNFHVFIPYDSWTFAIERSKLLPKLQNFWIFRARKFPTTYLFSVYIWLGALSCSILRTMKGHHDIVIYNLNFWHLKNSSKKSFETFGETFGKSYGLNRQNFCQNFRRNFHRKFWKLL